ncbi:MAG TPA: response regulator, partial [Rhodanobacteraceae bacterium]|nr:response regulator [Rhodanobacteraceae bacterium]
MIVGFMLTNRFPMLLWWGPDYISLYNDPYRPVLGAKHPSSALGLPARECWSEIWHVLKPLIDTPFHGGPSTWTEDLALNMNRHGFFEETHFTVAYSPVPDETAPRGIGGVMATVHEITDKIIGERQVATLRELAVATANAHSAVDACKCAADALRTNPQDVPFAMIYLADSKSGDLLLAGSCGIEPGSAAAPLRIGNQCPSPWPASDALRGHAMRAVPDLAGRFGKALPVGAWEEPPHTAALVPIQTHGESGRICMLVVGLNPFRLLAGDYQRFLELAAREIGAGIANAVAYEEERRRAEALAEIDRAKTAFFSNVSHEFRTPLSLILGPLEDALQEPTALAGERLELVHRNALRLLKLVNSLLDFSRIEAGRMQARFQPIELAHFTAELASNFKSATQRAGLALTLDCEPLPQPVYVDREMWEKIILNLVSNAFKFTLDGGIEISMHSSEDDQTAELRVHDTGSGIPEEELPRLFERFHRVENTRGRSFEGSGIGLALVRELVKQHGGSIAVESKVGRGTTFTVSIPFGKAHLPPERITEEPGPEPQFGTRIGTYVDEALRWLPDIEVPPAELQSSALDDADGTPEARAFVGKRVLLADDNLDMREYITRLLRGKGYVVEAVSDGAAALATIAVQRPDLVLSDVMMPRMDGFELLAALRDDPKLRDLPVIMLSARAGEEARVEGLAHGADDYLSKPFSARELLARVCSNLHLAGIRQEVEADLRGAGRS